MSSRHRLLGKSPAFLAALERLDRAASSDVPVLLLGESGTGKELAAKVIHAKSRRASGPFVAVNLAALPPTLIEDELFGHVAGAFTGATATREGRFQRSHTGTLFLDEIGDVPAGVQVKLLRVLETSIVEPLGSESEVPVDVRLVAATHRDLRSLASRGDFRGDLLLRLSVLPIELPPLRERSGDIELLARHFASRERDGLPVCELDGTAMGALESHSWPGNVRELENAIMRARALCTQGVLTASDFQFLSEGVRGRAQEIAALALRHGVTVDELERALLEQALRECHGNEAQAAKKVGLSRRAIEYRVSKWKS